MKTRFQPNMKPQIGDRPLKKASRGDLFLCKNANPPQPHFLKGGRKARTRVALMFILALPISQAWADLSPIATGKNAIGTLVVTRSDGIEDRLRGEGALQIFEGDILKTEANGQAMITLRDGTQVALNENTTLRVLNRWERGKTGTPILRMNQGEVWMKIDKAPKPVEIETPVAVAATTDAELNLKVLADGQSVLTTITGLVEFGTAFGTCPIRTGSISYGKRGERCTKPVGTDPKAATAWTQAVVK